MDGSEAGGDLVSIQTFLPYYVNQVKEGVNGFGSRAPLLERSGRFSGQKANVKIKTC